MVTKSDTYFIVAILFILLAGLGQQDTTPCSDRVEVCLPSASPFHCSCSSPSNTQCFWISFADPDKRLSDVTSEPILMWNVSTGYGQYMCVRADNLTAEYHQNVSRTILILPEAQSTSCDGCISTRICRATTGKYLLQFTKLFDQSLLAGDCGLHFTNHLLPNGTLTEEMCVELLPNFNYSILCPICYPNTRDIHYEIPIFNIENCSNSDICSSQSATTTVTSTMTISTSAVTTTTHITMATISTTFAVTTTINISVLTVTTSPSSSTASSSTSTVVTLAVPLTSVLRTTTMLTTSSISEKSKGGGSNNGAVIGGVVGGIIAVIIAVVLLVVVVLVCCIINIKKLHDRNSIQQNPEVKLDTISVLTNSGVMAGEAESTKWQADQPSVGQPTEDQTLLQQSKITDNTPIIEVTLKTATISNNVDTNEVIPNTSADPTELKQITPVDDLDKIVSDHTCGEDTKADISELLNYCTDNWSTEWESIGIKLELTPQKLKAISMDYRRVNHCCRQILIEWIRSASNPCYCKVVTALDKLNLKNDAYKLAKDKLNIPHI